MCQDQTNTSIGKLKKVFVELYYYIQSNISFYMITYIHFKPTWYGQVQSEVNISSTASPAPYAAAQQSLKPTSKIIQLKTKFCRHLEIFKLFSEITASCNTSKLPLLKCTNFQQSSLFHNIHLHGSLLRLARLFLMFLGQRGRRFQRSAFHGELLRLVP